MTEAKPHSDSDVTTPHSEDPSTTTAEATPRSSAGVWVVAALIAAIVSGIVVKVVAARYEVAMPERMAYAEEYAEETGREVEEVEAERLQILGTNVSRLNGTLAAAIAIVFGLGAGIATGHLGAAIIGICVAVAVSIGVGSLAGEPIVGLAEAAGQDLDRSDLMSIVVHAAQWFAIGVPTIFAVGIGAASIRAGGKAFIAVLVGAAVGAVLYVIVGALTDPMEELAAAKPAGETAVYLWSMVPPLVTGLVLARARP